MSAPIRGLVVLEDVGCRMCRAFGDWLGEQRTIVPLELVAAGSAQARARFPVLDHAQTLRDLTVVADTGEYWTNGAGWVMCLWATADYRDLALSLSGPGGLAVAKAAAYAAAGIHGRTTSSRLPGPVSGPQGGDAGGGYGDCRDGTCAV